MAINWSTGTGTNPHSVGLNVWLEGTLVKWEVHVRATFGVSQGQNWRIWGAASGAGSYRKEGPATQIVATGQFWGQRGATYEFGAQISGIYGNNDNVPAVYNQVTVPALPPAPPSYPPTATDVNQTQATLSWGGTSNANGANPIEDQLIVRRSDGVDVWDNIAANNSRRIGGLEPNRTYYAFSRIRNAAGWSEFVRGPDFSTQMSAPPAPSGLGNPVGAGGGTKTISWTNNPTSFAPYTWIFVDRWDNVARTWVQIARLGGGSTSYTDSSIIGDRTYHYRIYANNSGGNSGYAFAEWTDTTPAAPSDVAVEKSGTNIVLSWVNQSRLETYTTEVWEQSAGGDWVLLTTVAKGVTSYTHVNPSATVTHRYQVRSRSNSPVIYSGYVQSAIVQLAAPPNPPTITGPGEARDAALALTLTWRHNTVDSSPQRQRQVRYRVAGTTTWTTPAAVTSAVQSLQFAANTWTNGQVIEFQVQTWGQHATASGWSATYTVALSQAPTASITTPTATITTPTVDVAWGYYQAQGSPQASWEVELLQGSTLRERRAGSGATSAVRMATTVSDGTTWTLRLRLQSAVGLWSPWVSQTFSVSYPQPGQPLLGLLWDQASGSVAVGIDNVTPATGANYTITNLATNPSFTTATTGVAVTAGTGTTAPLTRPTSGGVDDGAYVRATWGAAATSNSRVSFQTSNRAPTVVGTTYTLSLWVRSSVQFPVRLVAGRATAVSGGTVAADAGSPVTLEPGVWTRLSYTFTATTGYTHVEPRVLTETGSNAPAGLVLDFDQLMIDASAEVRPYHDGSTPGYTTRTGYAMSAAWTGTANASTSIATYSPAPITVGNDVYRSINGGAYELIASNVPPNGTVTDAECAVAGTNTYYAVAWSALPSAVQGPPSDLTLEYDYQPGSVGSIWVSAAGRTCQARYAVEIEDGLNRARVVNQYEGRTYGVEVSSEAIERILSASWLILPQDKMQPGDASWQDWLALSAAAGPHLYRDKAGRRFWGTLTGAGPRMKRAQNGTHRASLTMQETQR